MSTNSLCNALMLKRLKVPIPITWFLYYFLSAITSRPFFFSPLMLYIFHEHPLV